MRKLPKRIKKKIAKIEHSDKKLWTLKQLRKEDRQFTKEAKLIRRVLLKERLERRPQLVKKHAQELAKRELREFRRKKSK